MLLFSIFLTLLFIEITFLSDPQEYSNIIGIDELAKWPIASDINYNFNKRDNLSTENKDDSKKTNWNEMVPEETPLGNYNIRVLSVNLDIDHKFNPETLKFKSDILCFQNLNNNNFDTLALMMKQSGFKFVSNINSGDSSNDTTIATFSKYKIWKSEALTIKNQNYGLSSTVEIFDKKLTFVNIFIPDELDNNITSKQILDTIKDKSNWVILGNISSKLLSNSKIFINSFAAAKQDIPDVIDDYTKPYNIFLSKILAKVVRKAFIFRNQSSSHALLGVDLFIEPKVFYKLTEKIESSSKNEDSTILPVVPLDSATKVNILKDWMRQNNRIIFVQSCIIVALIAFILSLTLKQLRLQI